MNAAALADVLARIDSGALKLELDPRPRNEWWNAYPTFKAEGWTFVVFDDSGGWDYLESVTDPSGEEVEFPIQPEEQCSPAELVVLRYNPADYVAWGYDAEGRLP